MRRAKAAMTVIAVAAAAVVLAPLLPAHHPPVIRLKRLTQTYISPRDISGNLDWLVEGNTQKWTAVFEVHNPAGRMISVNVGDVTVDGLSKRPKEVVVPWFRGPFVFYQITDHLRSRERKQILQLMVPPDSKVCRISLVYWPATARERWMMWTANWALRRRCASIFGWISMHLPDNPRKVETIEEVRLPAEAEVVAEPAVPLRPKGKLQ